MSPRPTIFISAVSKELRSARQLVANTLTFLGYEPVWQDIFGTETGDLREMLRQQIDQCKGVVQLVGQCYGAEPPTPDPEFGRISYTQFEALYGRKRGKKVWYLFMDEAFPIDPHEPEPEELRQLQASYRNILKVDTHLFHPLASREALEAGVLKLRDDLTQLRRGAKRWAWGIAALLVFIAVLVMWLVRGQGETKGSLEKIAQRFESLSSMGGLIAGAKTPEEHYHNARVHELGGNFGAARKEYSEYLSSNLEALDPWLSYSAMLKAAEGKAGAVETVRYLGDRLRPQTVSYQTALALLDDGDARLKKLQALAESHPDFGPLAWLISQEFSEARRGDQTLADQRAEKEWLEKFRAAHAAGKFEKYFLDKKEALKWIEAAEARWAKLSSLPQTVLENPVTLMATETGKGWQLNFQLAESKPKEIFYKIDGNGDFQSTGHMPVKNAQTGEDMVNPGIFLAGLTPGEHTIEVKYLDRTGKNNGPYSLKFDTRGEQLKNGKNAINTSVSPLINFTHTGGEFRAFFIRMLFHGPIIKEIRYSIDSEALDKSFPFNPITRIQETPTKVYEVIPNDTKFVAVQVTYVDGTKSPVRKCVPEPGD